VKLIPAIDLKDNKCVRLTQGKEETFKVYNENPVEQAKFFEKEGCERIHIIDLDSAFNRSAVNNDTIIKIRQSIKIPIELGGGIRSRNDAMFWFNKNIDYLIIGSLALRNSKLVLEIAKEFKNKIYISLDVLNNKIMIEGWTEETQSNLFNIFKTYNESKIRGYVLTDISRDGMMKGLNFELIKKNLSETSKSMVFGGGLSNYSDLKTLKKMSSKFKNIEGVIAGKSFYSGTIEIKQSINILNSDA
jgi:phosphoribosylformimino-5-aminoimidazole carboxamide ribotide isomerase